jgi:hypothetical protein
MPTDNSAFCAPAETKPPGSWHFGFPIRCNRPAPHRFQCNGEETKSKHIGDEVALLQRKAQGAQQAERYPAEGQPADKRGEPSAPEPRGHTIGRNDAKALIIGCEQKLADDHRDSGDEDSDEIAEEHLAQERRPIEREERTDAAESEGHDRDKAKSETRSDEKQAVAHSLHWKTDEALSCLLRRLAKQPFDAKAKSRKEENEHHHGPPTRDVCLEDAVGSLELVGQIGEGASQRNKMPTDRADAPIDIFRDRLFLWRRLFGGFGRALLFQPVAHLRIGEQCHKLGDLRGRRFVFARRPARPLVCRCEDP